MWGRMTTRLYAFNGSTGAHPMALHYGRCDICLTLPLVQTAQIYVGSLRCNNVYAFNGSTGALRWSYTNGRIMHTPLLPLVQTAQCMWDRTMASYTLSTAAQAPSDGATSRAIWCILLPCHWCRRHNVCGIVRLQSVRTSMGAQAPLQWSYTTSWSVLSSPAIGA
jgi:hypothetical protein